MKSDKEIFEFLIAGGVIGAELGALITNSKNGSALGAIAGAAILASFKANEDARKMNFPLIVVEDNALYQMQKDGTKKFIKQLPRLSTRIKKHYTLQ
jgi:hypothetical protein